MADSRDVTERVERRALRLVYRARRLRFIARLRALALWKGTDLTLAIAPSVRFGKDIKVRLAPRTKVEIVIGKGSQIFVQGRFQTRKWTDRDGNDRWTSEIVGERLQMLGGKREDGGGSKPAPRQEQQSSLSDLDDSDIPF